MKRAIIIGIDYKGEAYELPDCELDALNMKALLEKSGVDCTAITGECAASYLMSHLTTVEAIRIKPSDTLYLYFSGHGTQVPGRSEAICLYRKSKGVEVLLDKDLRAALDKIEGSKFLILDSCFSGGMDRKSRKAGMKRRLIPFDSDAMAVYEAPAVLHREAKAPTQKLYCLFACQKYEVAYSTGIGGKFTNGIRAAAALGKRTIKTVMSLATDRCEPDQTPKTVIVGGNNQKGVF